MAKRIDLVVPDQAKPGTSVYRLREMIVHYKTGTTVVRLDGDNRVDLTIKFSSIPASTLEEWVLNKVISSAHLRGKVVEDV